MPTYDDLSALFVNCTLKRSPERSHTQGLIDLSTHILETNGVAVQTVRAIDHDIATGVGEPLLCRGAVLLEGRPHVGRLGHWRPIPASSPIRTPRLLEP